MHPAVCVPPVCRPHTVFKNTQKGIQMGPRAPGKGLQNETWTTDSAVCGTGPERKLYQAGYGHGFSRNLAWLSDIWSLERSLLHFAAQSAA